MSIIFNTLITINLTTLIQSLLILSSDILKLLFLFCYDDQQIIIIIIMKILDENMLKLDFHDNFLQNVFFISLTEMFFIENIINIILVILYNLYKQLCQSISRTSI